MERARSGLSRLPLGRVLVALGLVLVAINVCSAVWDARNARERVERRAQRDFSNVTNLLAAQTAAALDAVDLVLRDAARARSAQDLAAQAPRLRSELSHVPHVAALLVFDGAGRVVTRTDADTFDATALAVQREAGAGGVYLSDPYTEPDGRWRVLLSRRIAGGGGIVAAAIEISSFNGLYRTLDLGEGGFITLLSFGGTIVARVPEPDRLLGRVNPRPDLSEAIQRDGAWQGWGESPILKERVLLAASAVRGFPLYVMNGAAEHAVFAPWRNEAWLIFDRTLLTSMAMLALIALAAWGLARRERALARTWRKYRSMIEYSSDALILTRPKAGGVLFASPAVGRVLGYTLDDLSGREVIDIIHPEYREAAVKARDELLGNPGKVAVDETKVLHKDGSYRWIELTRSNLLHEPSVGAVVMNFRDITERKEAEAERQRLEQRLRQAEKMEAVGRLAGGIAHDFNNILGGILGYAEMLAESAPPGSPLKRYADNVLTGATRAGNLVAQILSYSRSQRGARAPVDLARAVGETIELVRGSLPARVNLDVSLPKAPVHVVGDATQLHQVVMNLCTNAIHAMGQSGTLRVSLEAIDVPQERTFAHATLLPGAYARLSVQDDGSGMDAATLARIFEPFFTTKEVGQGTGLGLALVYGIVTDSGGAIDVSSAPGRGSRFAIYLPRVEAPAAEKDAAAQPIARGNGERVLVVDDEDALVAVTSEVLKRIGYEPVGCADGAAALAAFEAADGSIDAVIVDEVMPELSGTQLAQRLRRSRPDLPIVLMSGYTGPMLIERALGAGITEVLKKPVQSRDIAAALARVLQRA